MSDEELVAGRYEILEAISERPHGSVHKAIDHRLGRTVALKTLFLAESRARDELVVEARTLQLLDVHPNLPRLRNDFDLDDGSYVIVLDWVEGIDLQAKLEESGHPGLLRSSVVDWVARVAAALEHLHGQDPPIVHGDVKPANIVLTPSNGIVLLDFGIAKKAGQTNDIGTPGFIAPEVGAGEPVTSATDVYGLAATAFALLTGSPPTPGHDEWPGIEVSAIAPLKQVLQRGLATDPARRYATAHEFAQRLAAHASELPRGNVTLLAADVADADELWESDPELMDSLLARVSELVHVAVDEADGRVSGVEGGGERILAGFGSASAGLRAALAIRDRATADAWMRDHHVGLRLALHNCEPDQRDGQYSGRSVVLAKRIHKWAQPNQILVSSTSAPLLIDRLPPGTRLVEISASPPAGTTVTAFPLYAVESGEIPRLAAEPAPVAPLCLGPVVPPPTNAAPPRRRRSSDAMAKLIRERNEVDDALRRKLLQQDEAQRAGQPGLAAKFGDEAAESSKRLLELQRQIEQLEAEEGEQPSG